MGYDQFGNWNGPNPPRGTLGIECGLNQPQQSHVQMSGAIAGGNRLDQQQKQERKQFKDEILNSWSMSDGRLIFQTAQGLFSLSQHEHFVRPIFAA